MNNRIKHSGIVDAIEGDCVRVRILQTSACAQCKIASHCNSSECKEKIVDIYNVPDTAGFNIGDKVTVTASVSVVASALLLGFGIPFIILVTVVFLVFGYTNDEPLAALSGVLALLPYYVGVWLFRENLRTKIAFEIE